MDKIKKLEHEIRMKRIKAQILLNEISLLEHKVELFRDGMTEDGYIKMLEHDPFKDMNFFKGKQV